MTFSAANLKQRIKPIWWVEIEGVRDRYSTGTPSWSAPLSDDMLSWYKLDADAIDYSLNGLDGTIEKSPATYASGKISNALEFDGAASSGSSVAGTYQSVLIPASIDTAILASGEFTLSCWAYYHMINIGTRSMELVARKIYDGSTYGTYMLGTSISTSKVRLYTFLSESNAWVVSSSSLSINTWYHLVGTYSKTDNVSRIYINGVLDNTSTAGAGSLRDYAGHRSIIGAGQYTTTAKRGDHFDGLIDEVGIWDRCLTDDEVYRLYDQQATAHWRDVRDYLIDVPSIGSLEADPLNGSCSIPSHSFSIMDVDREITNLISVSDTPAYQTYLTCPITAAQTSIPIEDKDELPAAGVVYLDRETIYYTGTSTETFSGCTADASITAQTVDSGDGWYALDASRTEPRGFWDGATVTGSSGDNNGETQTIRTYDVGAFSFESPFSQAFAGGDTYALTAPPDKMFDASRTEADDYWNGAVITVTAGTNAGHICWVIDFDATLNIFTVAPPFPERCDATTTYTIQLDKLTGCTRGAYGSQANTHTVTDRFGAVTKRPVSTKLPFYKSRQVHIYEGRDGEDEDESISWTGYITGCSLRSDGVSYQFDCAGLLNILGQDLCWGQSKGKVYGRPLWGGYVDSSQKTSIESSTTGGYRMALPGEDWVIEADDGTIDAVQVDTKDTWPDSGNIRIDEEVIHYFDTGIIFTMRIPGFDATRGGAHFALEFDDSGIQRRYGKSITETQYPGALYLHCRGLFSEKLYGGEGFFTYESTARNDVGLPGMTELVNFPRRVLRAQKHLMARHEINAEVVQAIVCDDSVFSDFPRRDRITYSNLAGGTFAVGNTITGGTTSTTATVMRVSTYSATTGELEVSWMDPDVDGFSTAESISVGGVSADIDSFTWGVRPRNNVVDVLLQLLVSTGTRGANGPYDTLPDGMGLGIDADLVDVQGMEDLRDKYLANLTVSFVLHEPTGAKEFFEEQLLRPAQAFLTETVDGEIGLGILGTRAEAILQDATSTLVSFDDDAITADALPGWNSGGDPIGEISIKHNKHPVKDEYHSHTRLIFGDTVDWYSSMSATIELDLKTYYSRVVGTSVAPHNSGELTATLRRLAASVWDRMSVYPCPAVSVRTGYSKIETNIGDIVKLSHDALPNMRTGLRGLSSEYYQVIGKTPDARAGTIEWTLWQIGVHDKNYAVYAPSAIVLTYTEDTPSAGKCTLTFSHGRFSKTNDVTTLNDVSAFTAGDVVTFLTSAYTPIASPVQNGTIESVSESTMTVVLSANMGTNPAAGNIMTWASYDSCTTAQKAGAVFLADKDRLIGAANASAFKFE